MLGEGLLVAENLVLEVFDVDLVLLSDKLQVCDLRA